MFWELSEDAPNVNPRGLVKIAKDNMQGGLEYRQNELGYQGSSESRWRSGCGVALIQPQSTTIFVLACLVSRSPVYWLI